MSDYKIVTPPVARAEDDDPRDILWVRVGDLQVDQNVQRQVTEGRIENMEPWDWGKAEVLSVARRASGVLTVVEGQNRVLREQRDNPDRKTWAVLIPAGAEESAIALGIAKGRKAHSLYDQWRLRLHQGDPLVLAAEEVLAEKGLRLYYVAGNSGFAISAVGSVNRIMDTYDDVRASQQLLRSILGVLTGAYREFEPKRLDGRLIDALRMLFVRNPDKIRTDRLIETMRMNTAQRWFQFGSDKGAGQTASGSVAEQIARLYNRNLNTANKLVA